MTGVRRRCCRLNCLPRLPWPRRIQSGRLACRVPVLGCVGASGSKYTPWVRRWWLRPRTGVRAVMGDAAYAREFAIGAAMEHAEAVAYALGERSDVTPERDRTPRKGVVLGAREEEVGTLVAQGLSNKDIAARLFLSVRTVETHVHHLLNKLGVNSRTQIAVWFSEPRAS